MDANSTPPLKIHLPSSLPGSSLPIRAPLTIDSDSEFCLSIKEHICSRTSSFNSSSSSSSSSIDVSSYGDDHASVLEQDDGFVAYPDDELVIESCRVEEHSFTRPFVKYPDENYVKNGSHFNKSDIFRPFVKIPFQEGSSFVDGFGIKLGMPVAPLTIEFDSDDESVESRRSLSSGGIPANGNVGPKVRVFCSYEGDDEVDGDLQFDVFSGNDFHESNDPIKDSVSAKMIEEDEHKIECLNEVVKISKMDEIGLLDEHGSVFDCCRNESKKTSEKEEQREENEDDISFDSKRIDAQIVSDSDNKIEIETINEIEQGVFDLYGNESKKTNEKEEQREGDEDDISFDSHKIGAQIIEDLDNEIEIKTMNGIVQERVFDHCTKSLEILGETEEETLVKTQPIRPNFDFSLTILVIGKTGVGKSATINSVFRENKSSTNAFCPGTTTMQEIVGKINGIHVRILDTPGLRDSPSEQSYNRKVLASVKRFTRKRTPDIVLYVDRLDTHSRDFNDSCLLRLITSSLGSSVWHNCIVVLTHASYSDSLDESSGFVFQRCRFIQEQIVHLRETGQQTINPVWLIENQSHSSYKHDQNWQTRFLLLCCSAKILHEAKSVVEPSLNSLERDWFEFGDLDAGLEGLMGLDRVRPVEPLCKLWNGGKIIREHKKAYFEGYDHCVKVFGMKRWSFVCRLHF